MSFFCLIFSGAQQQQSAFKPTGFGATAQPAATGGLFGSSTPAFGAATTPAAGAFGQPQQQAAGAFGQPQQQAGSIGLFGANNQAKPLGKKPLFNRSSRRKRGMASNPLFIIPDFFSFSQ